MCSSQEELRQLLQRWDKVVSGYTIRVPVFLYHQGSKTVRADMLREFITQCSNMTCSELEQHFADCASLFLARITTWIRITWVIRTVAQMFIVYTVYRYMVGTCLSLQLKAISIFISSASG